MVLDHELFCEHVDGRFDEMGLSVAHDDLWVATPQHDIFKYKLCSSVCSAVSYRHSLCPSSKVFYGYNYVAHAHASRD